MAYADEVSGPYTVYTPGVLNIEGTPFGAHIASPDVHVDNDGHKIFMYYHGLRKKGEDRQMSCYAESEDGLNFVSDGEFIGKEYLRMFYWNGWFYGFSGHASRQVGRCRDRRGPFDYGPVLEVEGERYTDLSDGTHRDTAGICRMRHVCVHRRDARLDIYYSNTGDTPERIKRTTVDLREDWNKWRGSRFEEVLRSETDYEGVNEPLVKSMPGLKNHPVHEVRDPYIYEEEGKIYLFYSIAGEQGIALAQIVE
jgi:hypothetical protein